MNYPKGTKFLKTITAKDRTLYECIVEFPPQTRTVLFFYGTRIYKAVTFPTYQTFYITAIEKKNTLVIPIPYPNKFFGNINPINSLNDIIHPIPYPHVTPESMRICQRSFTPQKCSFKEYVIDFINQFWSSSNRFYIEENNMDFFRNVQDKDNPEFNINKNIQLPLKNMFHNRS